MGTNEPATGGVTGRWGAPVPRAPRANGAEVTRIVLADGQRMLRQALRVFLEEREDLRVVAEASSSDELLDVLRRQRPEVALVAIELPGISGLEVIRTNLREGIETRFIVVSHLEGYVHLRRAFEVGALGYVPKTADATELLQAIDEVRSGNVFLSPSLASVARALARKPDAGGHDRMQALTDREREVLALVGHGLSTREIAARLGVSPRTVEAHRSRLMGKLGVHRTAQLVRIAIEEHLVHR